VHNPYSRTRRSHTTQPQPCMQIVVKAGLTVAWSDSVRKTSGQWCSGGGDRQTAVEMWVVFTIAMQIVHKVKIKI